MKKYIITTDSGSDLPQNLIDKYNIRIVPMHVSMGNKTYEDYDVDPQRVYDYYEETGTLPKTSGATPNDYTKIFKEIFEEHPDAHIIHIGYSAVTTVSFNSAKIAAEDFENIHLVDSKHLSFGMITLIKKAAKFIYESENSSPEEIIEFVKDIRERTQMVFLPRNLLYLKEGGRVSNLVFQSAKLLRIHPTITLEGGYVVSGKKYRGTYERCLKRMVNNFFTNFNIDPDTIVVGGSRGLKSKYKEITYDLLNEKDIQPIVDWITPGPVITTHGGPGTVGIAGIEYKK